MILLFRLTIFLQIIFSFSTKDGKNGQIMHNRNKVSYENIEIESGIEITLLPQKKTAFLKFPKMTIKLTEKNEILLNKVIVSKEKMITEIKSFILENGAKHYIKFRTEKKTSYSFFCEIQNCIFSVYTELLNEKSRKIYNKSYKELNESEKIEIDKIYPKNIAE
jgi:hypothetical protein